MTTARHRTNAGRHPRDGRLDLHETPAPVTRALLQLERDFLPRRLWEPCVGRGAIARELEAAGFEVRSSDIADYGYPGAISGLDFLAVGPDHPIRCDVDGVVTNGPFYLCGHSAPLIQRAIKLVPYVALLLRLAFLEDHEPPRRKLTSSVSRVHIAARRLPMMHRDGWDGPRETSSTAYAWIIWDRRCLGSKQFDHFDWQDFATPEEIQQFEEKLCEIRRAKRLAKLKEKLERAKAKGELEPADLLQQLRDWRQVPTRGGQ
jgi:hypothetical protein